MHLRDYLEAKGHTQTAFADILSGVVNLRRAQNGLKPVQLTKQAVQRYCAGTVRPNEEFMVAIYIATGGAVQPNDFYELPELADLEVAA